MAPRPTDSQSGTAVAGPDLPAESEKPGFETSAPETSGPETSGFEARGPAVPAWLAGPRLGARSVQAGALAEPGELDEAWDSDDTDVDSSIAVVAEAAIEESSRFAGWVPERWRGARFAMSGRGLVVLALLGLAVAAIAGVGVARDRPATGPVPELPQATASAAEVLAGGAAANGGSVQGGGSDTAAVPEEIVVSVQGLVSTSGLVRLDTGARVADAIAAAGGALDGADLRSLNLAQRLSDGDQVLVGIEPTDGGPPQLGSATITGGGQSGGAGTASTTPGAMGGINLNTATADQLEVLPGVGPVTAQSIVDWRAANGRFTTVDQLSEVRGIGPARLGALRELVTV